MCFSTDHFNNSPLPRFPVSRSGNNPGRVRRVVSCKRKTHHLTVARRKQPGSGKTNETANKENEMNFMKDTQQEIFDMDPWEFTINVNSRHKTGSTGSEQTEYCTLTEVRSNSAFSCLSIIFVLLITVFLIMFSAHKRS